MENRLKSRLENGVAVFDGAMGTELYKKNFFVNTSYESLCLNNGDAVRSIHVAYRDAGAEAMVEVGHIPDGMISELISIEDLFIYTVKRGE